MARTPDNDALAIIESMIADPEYAYYFQVDPKTITREQMIALVEKERPRRALYQEETDDA